MNILPKVNYLFAMTPLGWFSSLNPAVNSFYWKGKKTSIIKLTTLQKPKQYGGLDAPSFYHYFLSHQLQYICHWTTNSNPAWLDIEQTICKDLTIRDIIFIDKSMRTHGCFKYNTINTTLPTWWKANLQLVPCNSTPFWHNPMFTINRKPIIFTTWKRRGITGLGDLFKDGSFMAFDLLKQTYNLPTNCQFQYLQLKEIIKKSMIYTIFVIRPPLYY